MLCRHCNKDNSNQISFYFEEKKVKLVAHVCKVCGYVQAEDEELIQAAKKHLAVLCQPQQSKKKNLQKKS